MASQKEIEAAAMATYRAWFSVEDDATVVDHFSWYERGKADPESCVHYSNVAKAIGATISALAAAERVRESEAREARKLRENWPFGCHCDLAPGQIPDGCFLDWGESYIHNCSSAPRLHRERKPKTACEYWRQFNPADYAKTPKCPAA